MKQHYETLVVGAAASGTIDVLSPWDESKTGSVETSDERAALQALELAHQTYLNREQWLSRAERIEILKKAGAIITERCEQLARQAAAEGGKPLIDSRVEVARAADGLQSCVDCLRTSAGEGIPMGLTANSLNHLAVSWHEPVGVVLAISAFNHPFNLIVHQVAPAIAAGCPVLVKPASETPLSCFAFVEILREAGLPETHCQAVCTDRETASRLVADGRVGFLSFIGSGKVGWMLRSNLAPGTRCALEHGGIAPLIVAPDAELDENIGLIAKGGFYHAGQVCVSVQRVYAHQSIAKRVVEMLAERAEGMVIGDPLAEDTEVGPLITHREVGRVDSWVDEAIHSGARCVSGGKRLSNSTYACTVLQDPPSDAKVSRQEIFGPVICVYTYEKLDEAIARANDTPFSFQAAVMTRDLDTALYCGKRLNASAVMVNNHTAFRVDWMPFAGRGQSGLGVGGIKYSFEEMQASKMMVVKSKSL